MDKVCEIFGRWGFGSTAIPALLSPPVPIVPFDFAAGAMQYPLGKYLLALTLGRISRYMVFAYLAERYGRQIIAFIAEHGHPVLLAILVALFAAAAVVFYCWGEIRTKIGFE